MSVCSLWWGNLWQCLPWMESAQKLAHEVGDPLMGYHDGVNDAKLGPNRISAGWSREQS